MRDRATSFAPARSPEEDLVVLPKRPVQHQVENRSRLMFEQVLPEAWVFRPEAPDYGIDGTVEVFDGEGAATGHRFFVQLKGTAAPTSENPKVRLARETCDYYMSLELPVLVVLTDLAGQRLFAKWFHQFDPFYGGVGEKWIRFPFEPEDLWTVESVERIEEELEALRRIRAGLGTPLTLGVKVRDSTIGGHSSASVRAALRAVFSSSPDVFKWVPGPALVSIEVTDTETVVALAGRFFATLHTHGDDLDLDFFAPDVGLLLAVVLERAGQTATAAQVALTFAENSRLVADPWFGLHLSRLLARAHRVRGALGLSRRLLEEGRGLATADYLLAACLRESARRSSSVRESIERYFEWRQGHEQSVGENSGVFHYNYGNFLASVDDLRGAVREYRAAYRLDLGYGQRDYFSYELAGILFQAGRYRLSQALYARALELGAPKRCHALRGDALLHAGNFEDALTEFTAYFETAEDVEAEWVLKATAVQHLLGALGLKRQARNRFPALSIVASAVAMETPDASQFQRALEEDAMCAAAWANLGVAASLAQDQSAAFTAFLLSALFDTSNARAWAETMLFGVSSSQENKTLALVFSAASQAVPQEQIVGELEAYVERGAIPNTVASAISDALDEVKNAEPDRQKARVRILGEEGQYEAVELESW